MAHTTRYQKCLKQKKALYFKILIIYLIKVLCQRNKIDMNSQILKVILALPSYFLKMIEEIWTEILLKKNQ